MAIGGYPAQLPWPSGPPTAVTLISFGAIWTGAGEVALAWQTGVEFDLLGFRLQRQRPGGDWLVLNTRLIPAAGDGTSHWYRFVDVGVPASDQTRYRLLEVDTFGQTHAVAEAIASVGLHPITDVVRMDAVEHPGIPGLVSVGDQHHIAGFLPRSFNDGRPGSERHLPHDPARDENHRLALNLKEGRAGAITCKLRVGCAPPSVPMRTKGLLAWVRRAV